MATLECKLAMCISRLVEFELLLELKIEQKMALHCIPRVKGRVKPCASVRPSDIYRYQPMVPLGPCRPFCSQDYVQIIWCALHLNHSEDQKLHSKPEATFTSTSTSTSTSSGSVVFIFQLHTSRQKSKPKLNPISPKI
jgi:hypothetical protein